MKTIEERAKEVYPDGESYYETEMMIDALETAMEEYMNYA